MKRWNFRSYKPRKTDLREKERVLSSIESYFPLKENPLIYHINQLTALYQFPKLGMSAKAPLLINVFFLGKSKKLMDDIEQNITIWQWLSE